MMTSENSKPRVIKVVSSRLKRESSLKIGEEPITGSKMAIKLFMDQLKDRDREVFAMMCLDSKGSITHYSEVHVGTLNKSMIHPREVFKVAILANSHAIIVAHNHPSGDLEPSKNDFKVTETLVMAGEILNIEVVDHIIVTDYGASSLRANYPDLFEG